MASKNIQPVIWALIIAPLLPLTADTLARQTSTVVGQVVDVETCEPLPFATVQVDETSCGTVTDIDGEYTIRHVPPGVYNVRASNVGYDVAIESLVVLEPNIATSIDFELKESEIVGDTLIIRSNHNAINVGIRGCGVAPSRISTLPVSVIDEILSLEAGVVEDIKLRSPVNPATDASHPANSGSAPVINLDSALSSNEFKSVIPQAPPNPLENERARPKPASQRKDD